MKKYHKILTVYIRDAETKFRTLVEGHFACPEFEYLAKNQWIFTEKVDGTNIRVMWSGIGGKVTFGGKTENAQIPAFLVAALEERFLTPEVESYFTKVFPDGVCLYGEGYGAKIQKGGGNYRPDQDFVLFDVRVGEWWLQNYDVFDVSRRLGIDIVPTLGIGTLYEMVEQARKGFQSNWGNFLAEGIVARPGTELCARSGHRIITKIKHKDFPVK